MRPRNNEGRFRAQSRSLAGQDELRAKLTGWGTSRQGHAIRRKYRPRFEQRLAADRRRPDHKEIWRALRAAGRIGTELSTDQFLDRLMVMGITAAADDVIGVDDDGIKNFTDQAIWFGQHLGLKRPSRDLEFRVGAWAIDLLNDQPFAIDKDGVLTLPLTPELDEFLNAVVEDGICNNASFFPSAERPEPGRKFARADCPRAMIGRGNRSLAGIAVMPRTRCAKRSAQARCSRSML